MSKLIVNNRLVDTDDFFRGALKMAHAELKKAVEERDALQAEVAELKERLSRVIEVAGNLEAELDEIGLSDPRVDFACQILRGEISDYEYLTRKEREE